MPNDPLQQLKDIQLPHSVSIFPLAPIWYVFMILAIALIIVLIILAFYKRRKAKRITSIYKMLDAIEYEQSSDMISQTSILIKRIAVMKFQGQKPHTLYGEEWLEFLDKTGKTTQFTNGVGRHLLDIYQAVSINEPEKFFTVVRQWIRTVI